MTRNHILDHARDLPDRSFGADAFDTDIGAFAQQEQFVGEKLGLVEVPVVLADDLTDAQVKAFRISVNRMAELAEWDNELLALELGELGELGFDLDLTGFGEGEIAALTPSVQPEQESSAKEIDADGFLLGHRCPRCGMEFDDEKT